MYIHFLRICRGPQRALEPPQGPRAARAQGRGPSRDLWRGPSRKCPSRTLGRSPSRALGGRRPCMSSPPGRINARNECKYQIKLETPTCIWPRVI